MHALEISRIIDDVFCIQANSSLRDYETTCSAQMCAVMCTSDATLEYNIPGTNQLLVTFMSIAAREFTIQLYRGVLSLSFVNSLCHSFRKYDYSK